MPDTQTTDETIYERPTTNVERREPANIHEAIRCVMLDLGGIPKMTTDKHRQRSGTTPDPGERGVKYAYRSIDQITGDAQQYFGLYGCTWFPKVLTTSERAFTQGQSDTRWTDTTMRVIYFLVGPGGAKVVVPVTKHFAEDGSYVEAPDLDAWYMEGDVQIVGPLEAIGRDNADKGTNKGMTQAFKQALLQVLSIGDPQDEGEHEKQEQQGFTGRVVTDAMATEFKKKVSALPEDHREALVAELLTEQIPVPEKMSTEQYGKANALLQLHVIQAHRGERVDGSGAVASAVVNPTAPATEAATEDEMAEARAFLGEMIEAVPTVDGDGKHQRDMLKSNLRGLFGDHETMTFDQVLKATAIASHWPDPVPTEREEAPTQPALPAPQVAGDPVPTTPGTPPVVTVQEQIRELVGDGPTDALIDEVIAEVAGLTATDRKEALRERGEKVTGNASDLGRRLAVALVKERTPA